MRVQLTNQIITASVIVLSLLAIACALVAHHFRIIEEPMT